MQFLTTDDFYHIKDDVLQRVINADVVVLDHSERVQLAKMQDYLRSRYDVSTIFFQTGTNRNSVLVGYLTDMVVYDVYARIAQRQVPQQIEVRYKEAIEYLKMVNKGDLSPNLPAVQTEDEQQGTAIFRYGSNPKKSRL